MPRCPDCNAELPAGAKPGLCPLCVPRQGLESRSAAAIGSEVQTAPQLSEFRTGINPTPQIASSLPGFDQFEWIGQGGMGVVYKARQKVLDRIVALKVLSPAFAAMPGFAERFSREARAMARLNHPNIVAVYDFGSVDDNGGKLFYFTMEFVDGSNLRPHRARRCSVDHFRAPVFQFRAARILAGMEVRRRIASDSV